jgi:hypothetical protein
MADLALPSRKSVLQVRYRDGRLVSTRGEKYIVESLREEYDGGSRGKVKTKGAGRLRC